MQNKFCLPVIKHSCKEVIEEIEQNSKQYHYLEVWLDYVSDADEKFIKDLAERYPHRIIFLFRRDRLEPAEMTSDSRFQLMLALDKSQTLLDLDVRAQLAEFEFMQLNKLRIKVIGSYHNYKKTPDLTELQLIAEEIVSHHPEIVKIATFCSDEEDALRLLKLQLHLKSQELKHIILGMGQHGSVTRVFGSIWGNEMIYAPITGRHRSAEGQLTREQFDTIFKALEY